MSNKKDRYDVVLGGYLKEIRKSKKLSTYYVGDKLGVSHQMISYYESGRTPITAKMFDNLCALYGVDYGKTCLEVRKLYNGK